MSTILTQKFPPLAPLTEHNLPSLEGRVFVVTGAYGGVGYHLALYLYKAGGRVYLAGRSDAQLAEAASLIQREEPASRGSLETLHVDMSDLASVSAAAGRLAAAEQRVHVLFNNAGVSGHPLTPRSAQGYDMHMATNVLGPFLLAVLLAPRLRAADGRVVWTASLLVDAAAPQGGLDMDRDVRATPPSPNGNYTVSKVANWLLASEMARRPEGRGILSLAVNPGSLWTGTWRWQPWWTKMLVWPGLYHARYGAYTNLWAGVSDAAKERNGGYVVPWGRWHPRPREDILPALAPVSEGGNGLAAELWDWCEQQTEPFMAQSRK